MPKSTQKKTQRSKERVIKPGVKVTVSQVADRAFQKFEERGYVHGHDVDDWTLAEAELRKEATQSVT